MTNKTPRDRTIYHENEEVPTRNRRRLLKSGVIAGLALPALPAKWTRPVVESVLLPVHADTSQSGNRQGQTSCLEEVTIDGCSLACVSTNITELFYYEIGLDDSDCLSVNPVEEATGITGISIGCVSSFDDSGDFPSHRLRTQVTLFNEGESVEVIEHRTDCEADCSLDGHENPRITQLTPNITVTVATTLTCGNPRSLTSTITVSRT